jgi:hypothetical protein
MRTFPPIPVPRPQVTGPPPGFARRVAAAVALAVAVSVGTLWALPASALVTEVDTVLVRTNGYDLGGSGFVAGQPDTPAQVTWDHAWFGVVPELTGLMHYEGVSGECTRVRMTSFDAYGIEIATDISDVKCANTNGHETRPVEEGGNDGLLGRGGAASVQITFQHETANGWARLGQVKEARYGQIIDTDRILIDRDEMDFGSGAFVPGEPHGAPSGRAELTWASSGGPIRPTLRGNLYMEDADDLCGRVRVRYLDGDGGVLGTEYGPSPELCPTDDDVHLSPVQIDAFAHNEIARVQVTLQKRGGSGVWTNAGTVTKALD